MESLHVILLTIANNSDILCSTTELVDDVMPQADLVHDENVFAAIGDEWEEQEEALDDSDSEIELNNTKKFLIFLIYFLFFSIPAIWFIKWKKLKNHV